MKGKMVMMIECVCCLWQGSDSELVMPFSGSEASCPECYGDDFIDVHDVFVCVEPMYTFMEMERD